MSTLLFLNPNLTMEQAMKLHKQQTDGFVKLCDQCKQHMDTLEDPKQRLLYYQMIMPLIMQQYALCL